MQKSATSEPPSGMPPAKPTFKSVLRKIWWFIWEDNSIWSWIANIILAFVIIKFLVYPTLGFALGTTHPVVAVVSGSMEHDGTFDAWWTTSGCCSGSDCRSQAELYSVYGISKQEFQDFSFKNGFNKGDLMILMRASDLELGDVVVFNANNLADPIIHRTVAADDASVSTKGDHNCGSTQWERDIPKDKLIGKAVLRLPWLGWIKIGFVELVQLVRGS